ncbi:NF038104 family lipoprotein [Mariprofundus ferrooxydans]|nr:NF038104 family lipoprotein [Mariprofundus ferrooxydans]
MKKIIPALLLLALSGCIGTIVGTAVDVTAEVIKAPFKIGSAIIDGVSGDDEQSDSEKD